MANGPVLVEVLRGDAVESAHSGAVAVVDARGTLRLAIGDVDRPVFPRSAVKVLQALPLVAGGAADRLGLDDAELALACASHNGEPAHAATAAAMLAKAGVGVDALECGTHWPMHEASARALAAAGAVPDARHNNCSGKHAGFVCVACLLAAGGAPGRPDGDAVRRRAAGYVRPDHPVMREVAAALQAATGVDPARAPVGTDGCSIPTWALPLRALALAFARVGTGQGLDADRARAVQRLRRAVAAAPFMVAGSGRFDTRLMEALGERVFCKVGAEGVYTAALPELGLGVAVKVDDGQARAAEVVMATLVGALLPLDAPARAVVDGLAAPVLRNWNGLEVGRLRAAAPLRSALAPG
ncbi:asparaginase [Piscinibacter sakaiensis]|uniref:Asparaginase n=1 Tax=Piscinibacter sakaiensis TaxID=1547922 RepID=A0A0K8P4B8_PISS1|nr:asparaginase [Piscinibacter sakaiensis]GAP37487.1 hypothetical protein of L-asparaginase type 2-like superfamily [Piscinibacter sakaiensis]